MKQYLEKLITPNMSWEDRLKVADQVACDYGYSATDSLCALLSDQDPDVRNAAALALKEISDDSAVSALVSTCLNPQHKENRATLVYALEELDCSEFFSEIFELLLSGNAEVVDNALNIFNGQGFYVDEDDVANARKKLRESNLDNDLKLKISERLDDFED